MKKFLLAMTIAVTGLMNAQTEAYSGAGDIHLGVAMGIQEKGTSIVSVMDFGVSSSFSAGFQAGYVLGYKEIGNLGKPDFEDRIDIRGRLNANLGRVIGLPSNYELYPGLNLGLKNFGGHVGARTIFSHGFGAFTEVQFPIAKYNKDASAYEKLNNQFQWVIGVAFDLN